MDWVKIEGDTTLPSASHQWYLISVDGMTTMAFFERYKDTVIWSCHNDASDKSEWERVTHWAYLPEPAII